MVDATPVCTRLRERRAEIESALAARVIAISDSAGSPDPAYRDGLRSALGHALDFAIAAMEQGEERPLDLPMTLVAQARSAAQNDVGLDTVLRRYLAGYGLLGDFVVETAIECGLSKRDLKLLLRRQAALLDPVLSSVSAEYRRESGNRLDPISQRRRAQVERLLRGELVDPSTLDYSFDRCHIGLSATGSDCEDVIAALTASLDCRLLLVRGRVEGVWAWLGVRRSGDAGEVIARIEASWRGRGAMAIGDPGRALAGWRQTHRQAVAALPVALRSDRRIVRYSDVALLCSAMSDDLLSEYLKRTYLDRLEGDRGGGHVLKGTLRTYFDLERNVSSVASALGISRQTVSARLRTAEQRIGRPLKGSAGELHTALRLDELYKDGART